VAQALLGEIDGLLDEPRPGVPRAITEEDVERVIRIMLEETPREIRISR